MGSRASLAAVILGLALLAPQSAVSHDCGYGINVHWGAWGIPPCHSVPLLPIGTPPSSCTIPLVPGWWVCLKAPSTSVQPSPIAYPLLNTPGKVDYRLVGNYWQLFSKPNSASLLLEVLWE